MDVLPKFDYRTFAGFLDEAEAEILKLIDSKRIGASDHSQLAAVLFLLIRASSLLRASLSILEWGRLDAYDAVRRAYWEAWALAFEFRLAESQPKAAKWHEDQKKFGEPDIKKIEDFMKLQGIASPLLGKDYGGLSEVAHPTKSAAVNSMVVVVAPRGGDTVASRSLIRARASFEQEQPETMFRFLWMLIEERQGLIQIGSDLKALPTAYRFTLDFENASPKIRKRAKS
jgi:hypothetical protein